MKYEEVTLTFKTYWQFKDYKHLKVTRCKKIICVKTNKILKYGVRGYCINGKYYKRNQINDMVELIKSNKLPF